MTADKTLSKEQVLKVARLACLTIDENGSEIESVTGKLNSILGYISSLNRVDVEGVEPMSHVHGSTNIFRGDNLEPSLPVQELLKITPASSGRFIKVPIVIDQQSE